MVPVPERSGFLPALPEWVNWLQAGFTALLVVLFAVMLAKSREQSDNIRLLQQRVQGLENSRALERTTGLEQQLRSTVERLQSLERSAARIDGLTDDNAKLRQELRQLRIAAQAPKALSEPLAPLPPLSGDGTPSPD